MSPAGKGSAFWVEAAGSFVGRALDPTASARAPAAFQLASEGRRLVLYVEDNPANVTFMKDLMSTFAQIDLLTAPTAEMGVELARGRRPELVIMDINLPGMSGIEALRALRAVPETSGIPVIALSAAASERDKERGTQAGFYRYLTKPLNVDEFVMALEALLTPSP